MTANQKPLISIKPTVRPSLFRCLAATTLCVLAGGQPSSAAGPPALPATLRVGLLNQNDLGNSQTQMQARSLPDVDGMRGVTNNLWERYQKPADILLSLATLTGLTLSLLLWRSNRRLRELSKLYFNARASLQTTAAAFDSQVGLLVTDNHRKILRVNTAFTQILGYTEGDLKGSSTRVLRAATTTHKLIDQAMSSLRNTGRWHGEINCRHKDGHLVPCLVTVTSIREEAVGMEGYVGSIVDVSQQRRDRARIEQLAFFDSLTGLRNRSHFLERLRSEVELAHAAGLHGALMFLDLDHFKNLNDMHGHDVGDQLLQQIAYRLQAAVDCNGMVARLGGDEFVILLPGLSSNAAAALEAANQVAEQVRASILQPYQLSLKGKDISTQLNYNCSGSIGITLFGHEALEVPEVMKRADIAMFIAKQAGRNTIRHYDPRVQHALHERGALGSALTEALRDGQLMLDYQLQVDRFGAPLAAECLLRWQHPARGLLRPAEFIPIAEDNGAIVEIGDWVIEQACMTLARWQKIPALAHLELCVNVSPRQFSEARFARKLSSSLQRHQVRPAQLTLEITESVVLERNDMLKDSLHTLCELGVSLSIDDFGTGYSSLTYLQRLPLRQVKIHGSFIADFETERSAAEIVRAIIALARSLHLTVVAEGVETEAQRLALIDMGCELLQGYHLSPPMKLQQLEQRLLQDG